MKIAILIDGGFFKPKYRQAHRKPASAPDVVSFAQCAYRKYRESMDLLRIYYYDSPPLDLKVRRPVSGAVLDLSKTPIYVGQSALMRDLKSADLFAVREGRLAFRGWTLKKRSLKTAVPPYTDSDFEMEIQQKGVDTKLGLDIAWIANCKIVDRIVVVTGDSDFVPAFKAARRSAVQVVLLTLNHGVMLDLIHAADIHDSTDARTILSTW